jgi:alkylation response protein AidB-like acyl-CoA dehydrogenase
MINDGLYPITEEERMLHASLRKLGEHALAPHAEAWDAQGELPARALRDLSELGLDLITLSEERGGVGLGLVAALRVVEALAAYEPSLALKVGLTNGPVALCAPEGLEGSSTWAGGALHITSRGASGALLDTPWSERARWALVPQGHRLYAVDLQGAGVSRVTHEGQLGLRCAEWADLHLNNARVLASPLSAERHQAAVAATHLVWAALAVGVGAHGATLGRRYAEERVQFGQPIARLQAIQWMIADSLTELDAARLLTYTAAAALDAGHTEEGARLAAEARLLAADAGHAACDRALQIHGGYGYTRDYHIERAWRDVQRAFPTEGAASLTRLALKASGSAGGGGQA